MALEQLERYLSTGELPDPNDLPYKMYAVVENGLVKGYVWDTSLYPATESTEFVLMTYANSPAYTNGTYKNGKFYPEEKE